VEGNSDRPTRSAQQGDSFVGQLATPTGKPAFTQEKVATLAGGIYQSPNGPQFQGKVKITQGSRKRLDCTTVV